MPANGSVATRLTNSLASDRNPAWSPDGWHIAFDSTRDPNAFYRDIYVMNADGSEVSQLTNNPGGDSNRAWSPFLTER